LEKLFVPTKVLTHTKSLKAVRDYVISRASGRCQLCGAQAPFNSPDGKPYLEVHNVIPFRNGDDNSTYNLIALCPNCHRKVEVSPTASDLKKLKLLRERYEQLEPN
jgi:5-methylcytosine-specific restriction protein A